MRRISPHPVILLAVLPALLAAVLVATPLPAAAATNCDRWVADVGSDAAVGTTRSAPLRTLAVLAAQLQPGETGCIVDGSVMEGNRTIRATGTADAPVTIMVEPGGTAQVRGQTHVDAASHDLVLRGIRFTGLDLPRSTMLIVAGDRIRIEDSELTSPLTICLDIKSTASHVTVTRNRVHHCGTRVAWTSQDSGAHGVYVQDATDVAVVDNVIHDNAYRGVQTWPGATRVRIERNVFLRNGTHVNLGHDGDRVSRDVRVANNVMADATLYRSEEWKNVSSVYGYLPDRDLGNVVEHNCIHQARRAHGEGVISGRGLTVGDNRILDEPVGFVDVTTGDVQLRADSPCVGIGPARIQPSAVRCGAAGVAVDLGALDVDARASERGHWLRAYVRDVSGTWRTGPWMWRGADGTVHELTDTGWVRAPDRGTEVTADRPHGTVWVLRYALQGGAWTHDWLSAGWC